MMKFVEKQKCLKVTKENDKTVWKAVVSVPNIQFLPLGSILQQYLTCCTSLAPTIAEHLRSHFD